MGNAKSKNFHTILDELLGLDKMPKISFLVLAYNSANYIGKLLESIEKFHKADIEEGKAEIIVVDNASADKTLDIVRKYKFAKVIENKENLGFSKGINTGAKKANGEYLVLINPDAEIKEKITEEVIKDFKQNDRLGVLGGKISDEHGRIEKSTGKFLKSFEILLMSLGLDEFFGIRNSFKSKKEVDFVSGAFMIVPKNVFDKLGGFDENLFMYVEDMEFCYRAKKEGFKVLFSPSISIVHHRHGSSDRSFAIKSIHKGLLYFQKKHGNSLSYFVVRLMLGVKTKSSFFLGKILKNKYLSNTYTNI